MVIGSEGRPVDDLDRSIINHLQGGFPVCERPFAQLAQELATTEDELISRISTLLEQRVLSRFGPMYNAERIGGALTLCAMWVPEEVFEEVAEQVNAHPEVAHNYARDHELNMWFVLATETPQRITDVIEEIEQETGLRVLNMPKIDEFFIGLRLDV
jgi:DNA-binding Lrp family transcriptional regulator